MRQGLTQLDKMETLDMSQFKYVLVDDEGNIIRYFDHPAEGTIKLLPPIFDINKCEPAPF